MMNFEAASQKCYKCLHRVAMQPRRAWMCLQGVCAGGQGHLACCQRVADSADLGAAEGAFGCTRGSGHDSPGEARRLIPSLWCIHINEEGGCVGRLLSIPD